MSSGLRILIVEDDAGARHAAAAVARQLGHDVTASGAADAVALVDGAYDVVIAGVEGPAAPEARPLYPRRFLYLRPPIRPDDLRGVLTQVEARERVRRPAGGAADPRAAIIGQSPAMRAVLDVLPAVADSDAPVLLTGESGTGKELLARAIHEMSRRADGPLVAVNCAAIPDSLFEAEMFGHERGAFTDAVHRRPGQFLLADGGTLLLDEVDRLSPVAQAKLLRVLQDGRFRPLGADSPVASDFRLICASNRDLRALMASGELRADLYFRIGVLDLAVPPLRARDGDLPLLVQHFLLKHAPPGCEPPSIEPRAWAVLGQYGFPGNVRQLEHALHRALVMARGRAIDVNHLPADLDPSAALVAADTGGTFRPLAEVVSAFEDAYVLRALELAGGKRIRAARMLGISRKSLWQRLNRINRPRGLAPAVDPAEDEHGYEH